MIGKLIKVVNRKNNKKEKKVYYRTLIWDHEKKKYTNLFLTENDCVRLFKRESSNSEDCIYPNAWVKFWCFVASWFA